MDPKLKAALEEYLAKRDRARAAGVEITPAHEEEFFRARTGGKYGREDAFGSGVTLRNVGRSAAQGASLGFADELTGLVAGPAARDSMRARNARFQQDHPKTAFASELAGGVLPSIVVPGGASATVGRAVAKGVVTGATMGAVSGAGHAEGGIADRAKAAVPGAVIGGVLGGAIPAGVGISKYFRDPAARATARVQDAIAKTGGPAEAIALAKGFANDGRGREVMLADLSGHTRQAADFAANNSDEALVGINAAVKVRGAGQSERLMGDMRELAGDHYAPDITAKLEASRRAWAASAAGYEGLRQAHPELAPTVDAALKAVLKQPRVRDALAAAKQDGLIGAIPDKAKLSFAHLQDVAEMIDDAANAAFKKGKGNLGSRLADAHRILKDEMVARVPGLAEVDAEYAQRKSLENAVELGKDAWNAVDTRGFQQLVDGMGEAEREVLRRSMVSEAIAKLRSAATNRDEAKRIVDAGPAMQDKLKVVFGSRENFDTYMRRAAAEAEMARLKGAVGGSQTARRLQAQGYDPAEGAIDVLARPQGLVTKAIRGAARMAKGAVTRGTAREMTPMLLTQGSDEIEKLIQSLTARDALVGRASHTIVPGATASALGGLLSY